MEEKKILALGRSQKPARRRNNFSLGLHEEILFRVINQVAREFKRADDNNKHAICAPLLLSLLALITTFLQSRWQYFTTGGAKRNCWILLPWLSNERSAAIYPPKAVHMVLGSFQCYFPNTRNFLPLSQEDPSARQNNPLHLNRTQETK